MCFIDWATKCVAGKSADFYGVQGCDRWAARERRAARRALASYQNQVNDHPQGSKTQRRILRRVKAHQEVVDRWNEAINKCISTSKGSYTSADFTNFEDNDNDDYYDEYDDTDVSGYQRTGAQVSQHRPKAIRNYHCYKIIIYFKFEQHINVNISGWNQNCQ